jgi:hypothetical protein
MRASGRAPGTRVALVHGGSRMSQRTVELIIGRLVTDEDLRARFQEDAFRTIAAFCERGHELSRSEIDALISTDPALWSRTAEHIHPSLQRCDLRSE